MTFDIGMRRFSEGISFAFLAFSNAKHFVKNFFFEATFFVNTFQDGVLFAATHRSQLVN